jgi:hypothetical protein
MLLLSMSLAETMPTPITAPEFLEFGEQGGASAGAENF